MCSETPSLSLTRIHTYTQLRLFQADTITAPALASVPYLKLINAASNKGGHQEISNPSPSLLPFTPQNMINGIYLVARTPCEAGLDMAGHDLAQTWHISVSHMK